MNIPLLGGVGSTEQADLTQVYPVNLEPIPIASGLSKGYFRQTAGARQWASGPGTLRGAITWNGVAYAVMGTKLVSLSSTGIVTTLGDVGPGGPVALDYGFDRMSIQSGVSLYYWNGTTLTQVTDPDLGQSKDALWFNGYYVSIDDDYIVVTDLADPTAVNPLKYGSAEADPDKNVGLIRLKVGNELYVGGTNSIEVFTLQAQAGFPFQVSEGAAIPYGFAGPRAKCLYGQTFAFCGSARNEAPGVYLAGAGTARKLSTRAIDDELAKVADPTSIILESRVSRDEQRLLVHLPDKTLVYLGNASQAAQEPVWYVAKSGDAEYRLRFATLAYGKWIVGDTQSGNLGILDEGTDLHFGDEPGWQFVTQSLYNEAKGGIVHELELTGLFGRGNGGTVFLSFSLDDGATWTMERAKELPAKGQRTTRVRYSPHKRFRSRIIAKWRGLGLASIASQEATIEPLSS